MLIGLERDLRSHPAGIRTHALVSLGACLFALGGAYGFAGVGPAHDPTRVAAQVASGIGFLGAGAILRQGRDISGLTTAATLWLSAAVGLSCASNQMLLAAGSTAIALVIVVLGRLSKGAIRGACESGRYRAVSNGFRHTRPGSWNTQRVGTRSTCRGRRFEDGRQPCPTRTGARSPGFGFKGAGPVDRAAVDPPRSHIGQLNVTRHDGVTIATSTPLRVTPTSNVGT